METARSQTAGGQVAWNELGQPIIENISTSGLDADAMNWASVRDARGVLYVGNTDGILEYDGVSWRMISSVNGTPALALALAADGTLYFGLYGAFGRIVTDGSGKPQMELLSDRLQESDRDFTYVYDVHATGDVIWFRSEEGIFRWDGSNISIIRPRTAFKQSFLVDGLLYVLVKNVGLHLVGRNGVTLAPGGDFLAAEDERLNFMLHADNGRLLLGTKLQGAVYYDGKTMTPAWTAAIRAGLPQEISCGVALADSTWAIGTRWQGIWIVDREGSVRRIFDDKTGLQNNSVIALSYDREHMLWAALDNGLSRIEWPSSVTTFGGSSQLEGRLLSLARFRERLYVSTTLGVFRMRPAGSTPSNAETGLRIFERIQGLPPDCFDILERENSLLFASAAGVHSYDGSNKQLLTRVGARILHPIHGSNDSILIGTERGLHLLTHGRSQWFCQPVFPVIGGIVLSIKELPDRTIWVGTLDGLAYSLTMEDDFIQSTVRRYSDFQNENSVNPVGLQLVRGSLWLWTEDTLCVYNAQSRKFDPDPVFWRNLGVPSEWVVRAPYEDSSGRIWMQLFGKSRRFGYATPQGRETARLYLLPALEQEIVYFIKSDGKDIVWICGETDLYRFDRVQQSETQPALSVLIRKLTIGTTDYYFGAELPEGDWLRIPYTQGSVRIQFAAPSMTRNDRLQYRWKLSGLNEQWTDWSFAHEIEYPTLSDGSYIFHVEARNAAGVISDEAILQFRTLPPWQRSWWAYAVYGLLLIGLFVIALRYRTRTLEERSRILEQTIRDRTEEIRSQAEKIRSQAEELETLDSIVRTVNKEVHLTDLLSALLQQTLLLFPHVNVACYLQKSPDDTLFRLVALVGEPLTAISANAFSLAELIDDQSNTIQTLQDGVYVLRGLEKRWNLREESLLASQKAFMGMSDIQHGQLRGFLVLGSEKNHSFSADDLRRLLRLREHVSSAVAKAVAIRELEQKNTLLDKSNTQLRDAQQQLIVHEKLAALGELTAGIAHEIQNPLNFVNNFSSLSLEMLDELEEFLEQERGQSGSPVINLIDTVRGNCERIREHGMRATSIVSAMLLHTRKGGARRENIPLNEFLDQFVMLSYHGMRMLHPQYELKLLTEYDRGIESVSLSPQEMSRVIVNICNNAWESAIEKVGKREEPMQPEVTVRSINTGDHVRICVRDNGDGIPDEMHAKIFEPFFTTKESGNNAGLGLSMSYEIVTQMHKGALTVDSKPGSFAEFIIELPKESAAAQQAKIQ